MIDLHEFKANKRSQYGEDGIIAKILDALGYPCDLRGFSCMDVGAWDGKHLSNVHALVERGATALEIEADPKRFEMLCRTRDEFPRIFPANKEVTTENIRQWSRVLCDDSKMVFNLDIDGDHAALLKAMADPAWPIVVVEWCDHGDRSQYVPLRQWGDAAGYKCVAKTNSNLVFVRADKAHAFKEVAR